MSIQCGECKTISIDFKMEYWDKGQFLGEWPVYYFGAGPNNPMDAKIYFCGAICANIYYTNHKSEIMALS